MPLMDVGFAIICSLARHRRPQIQFLSIGSRVCSTLLSDLTSRFGPCALLSLRLHQAVKRTFTSKLSNMLGTQKKGCSRSAGAPFAFKEPPSCSLALSSLAVKCVFVAPHKSFAVLFLVEVFIPIVLTESMIGVFVRIVFFWTIFLVIPQISLSGA